jgi:hypothetical protein
MTCKQSKQATKAVAVEYFIPVLNQSIEINYNTEQAAEFDCNKLLSFIRST